MIASPSLGSPRVRPFRLLLPALALSVACSCEDRELPKPGLELRSIHLTEVPAESPEHGIFGAAGATTHRALLERLEAMTKEKNVAGVILDIGEMGGAFARATDLRDALLELRKVHKPVHCHFETTDSIGYGLLAQSCDRITITPAGMLDLVGLALETIYARQLLATLGLRADFVQIGPYKGAADPLTRDDMPPEVRTTMNALLDDFQAGLVSGIARGRSLPEERVRALIDQGPFTADDAKRAGLVDDVAFEDAARSTAKSATKAVRIVEEELHPVHDGVGFWEVAHALFNGEPSKVKGRRLAIAYLDGTITRGSRNSYHSGQAEAFIRAMHSLADDDDVRAVVLRIRSPGGSALASDLMWHAVRRVVKRKPVIVSISDLCASGGYYVASAGSEIFAQDASMVGSIGIVGGKIVAEELVNKIGIHDERIARGKHAGWQSALHGWDSDEHAVFERELKQGYALFISRIAEGRNMKPEQIEPLAEGRLMSARRAREGGLVDREGGLMAAVALARKRGSLPDDAPVQVWPERPTFLQTLSEFTGGEAEDRAPALPGFAEFQRQGIVETVLSGDDMPAAVLPFVLSIR